MQVVVVFYGIVLASRARINRPMESVGFARTHPCKCKGRLAKTRGRFFGDPRLLTTLRFSGGCSNAGGGSASLTSAARFGLGLVSGSGSGSGSGWDPSQQPNRFFQ